MSVHCCTPRESGIGVEKQARRCVIKAIGMDTLPQGGLVIMDRQAVKIYLREEGFPSHSVIQGDSRSYAPRVRSIPIQIFGPVVLLDPATCQPPGYFPDQKVRHSQSVVTAIKSSPGVRIDGGI